MRTILLTMFLTLTACLTEPGTDGTETDRTGVDPTDQGSTDAPTGGEDTGTGGHTDGDGTTETDGTTDTDPGTGTTTTSKYPKPKTLDATCAQAGLNALRFTCDVTVDPPQPVQITFSRTDGLGATRVHTSDAVTGTHTIPLYFLAPTQEYQVDVAAIEWPADPVFETTVTAGQPPFDIGSALETTTGTPTVPLLGTENPCDTSAVAVIYDTSTGDLVWYANLDPSGSLGLLDMVQFTANKTILGETDETISEIDLVGNSLTNFSAAGLGGCCGPHHDVFTWNDQYYVIHQYYPAFGLTLDALVVYDKLGNELQHWYPDDVLTTIPGGASGDFFHTNTIYVDDNGDIYLNYLTQETFIKLVGDVTSPDFGEPIWIWSPDGSGDIGNDFTTDWSMIGGADGLGFQHNLNLTHDGRMLVLDNTNGRGLVFTYDEVNFTATVDAQYETYENACGPQGTAMDTEAGTVIVACNTEWLREYDMTTTDLLWEAEVTCRNGGSGGFFGGVNPTRWYPLEGW